MVRDRSITLTGPDDTKQQYRQAPFPYQGKCLRWLREGYAALDERYRYRVDAVLAGSGCEVLVE